MVLIFLCFNFIGDNIFGLSTLDVVEFLFRVFSFVVEFRFFWVVILGNYD